MPRLYKDTIIINQINNFLKDEEIFLFSNTIKQNTPKDKKEEETFEKFKKEMEERNKEFNKKYQ